MTPADAGLAPVAEHDDIAPAQADDGAQGKRAAHPAWRLAAVALGLGGSSTAATLADAPSAPALQGAAFVVLALMAEAVAQIVHASRRSELSVRGDKRYRAFRGSQLWVVAFYTVALGLLVVLGAPAGEHPLPFAATGFAIVAILYGEGTRARRGRVREAMGMTRLLAPGNVVRGVLEDVGEGLPWKPMDAFAKDGHPAVSRCGEWLMLASLAVGAFILGTEGTAAERDQISRASAATLRLFGQGPDTPHLDPPVDPGPSSELTPPRTVPCQNREQLERRLRGDGTGAVAPDAVVARAADAIMRYEGTFVLCPDPLRKKGAVWVADTPSTDGTGVTVANARIASFVDTFTRDVIMKHIGDIVGIELRGAYGAGTYYLLHLENGSCAMTQRRHVSPSNPHWVPPDVANVAIRVAVPHGAFPALEGSTSEAWTFSPTKGVESAGAPAELDYLGTVRVTSNGHTASGSLPGGEVVTATVDSPCPIELATLGKAAALAERATHDRSGAQATAASRGTGRNTVANEIGRE